MQKSPCVYAKPLNATEAAAWAHISKRKLLDYASADIIGKTVGGCWLASPTWLVLADAHGRICVVCASGR